MQIPHKYFIRACCPIHIPKLERWISNRCEQLRGQGYRHQVWGMQKRNWFQTESDENIFQISDNQMQNDHYSKEFIIDVESYFKR